jgi:glycine betaine/choline ABC-type transport system substrate-binding protein
VTVERRFDLGGNLAHEALVAGEVDIYPEYTGTALLAILNRRPVKDPREVSRLVADEYAKRFDLVWTDPFGFNNTFAILVRGDDARRLNLKTITDAARVSAQWRAGFGQDFMSRADGYPGFARTYGFHFQEIREMDLSLTYRALAEKQVDLIAGNSTDGLIARYGLLQLEDDRKYFPPYDAVPVARRAMLEKYPKVRDVLKRLGGILTVEEMRKLNYAVDGEKRQPKDVAREFLLAKKILSDSRAAR